MRARFVLLAALLAPSLRAESPADLAVLGVLQRHDASLSSIEVHHRGAVTDHLDLVVAIGGHARWRPGSSPVPKGGQQLGLFLQERGRPDLVYTLSIQEDACGGTRRVIRATATDTVLSCTGEKSEKRAHEKFVHDVQAMALVSRFSYPPFSMVRIFDKPGGAVIVGSDGKRLRAVEFHPARNPQFRVMEDAVASPWTRRVPAIEEAWRGRERSIRVEDQPFEPVAFGARGAYRLRQLVEAGGASDPGTIVVEDRDGRSVLHPLPQSTAAEFAKARPSRLEDFGRPPEIREEIGPHVLEGDVLWFGKDFYDAEGTSGVGGFGHFDAAMGTYRLFAPSEIVDWSVAALHVDPDAVWMALAHYCEWGTSSGGLLRYDRASGSVTTLEMPDVGVQFLRVSGQLLLATDAGIAVVADGQVRRWFVDRTTDGRWRMAEAGSAQHVAARD